MIQRLKSKSILICWWTKNQSCHSKADVIRSVGDIITYLPTSKLISRRKEKKRKERRISFYLSQSEVAPELHVWTYIPPWSRSHQINSDMKTKWFKPHNTHYKHRYGKVTKKSQGFIWGRLPRLWQVVFFDPLDPLFKFLCPIRRQVVQQVPLEEGGRLTCTWTAPLW